MSKQVVIAAILAGVIAAVFAPVLLRDGEEDEAPTPVAEEAKPSESGTSSSAELAGSGESERADGGGDTAQSTEAEPSGQETAEAGDQPEPEPAASADGSSEPQQVDAAPAAQPEETSSAVESSSAGGDEAPTTMARADEAPANEPEAEASGAAGSSVEAPKAEPATAVETAEGTSAPEEAPTASTEAAPSGRVAAQIQIADIPTIKEGDEPSTADAESSSTAEPAAIAEQTTSSQASAASEPSESTAKADAPPAAEPSATADTAAAVVPSSAAESVSDEATTTAEMASDAEPTAVISVDPTTGAVLTPVEQGSAEEIPSAPTGQSTEEGTSTMPSVTAEADSAASDSEESPQSTVEVVSRPSDSPQVAALPDQPEATDLPPARRPSFDVVRVEPTGEAVIAGRAEPGSQVTLTDDEDDIASVQADSAGDWVIILEEPLEGGSHQLGLTAETPAGQTVESENVVIVAVPEKPKAVVSAEPETAGEAPRETGGATATATVERPADKALAVLAPREGQGPSVVLQKPDSTGIADRELVLSAIDYDAAGRVIISGKAPPGARVVVYLDEKAIGQVEADENGNWVLRPEAAVTVGLHRLRLDQLDAAGKVVARVESPFSRAQALLDLPGERFVVVQPGNSLWFIARETYGQGLRYTLIFEGNSGQIRDPDLIYPGQIFLVPELN